MTALHAGEHVGAGEVSESGAGAGVPLDLTKGVFTDDDPAGPAEKRCKYCDRVIVGRHPSADYCSDDHKERAYRERKNGGRPSSPSSAPANRKKSAAGELPVGASVWAALGYGAQMFVAEPVGPPVGRVMQFQAADAGPRVERIGARLAKALPFISTVKKQGQFAGDVAALLAPPLLTALIATGNVPRAIAEPVFVTIMRPLIADALEKAQEQAETITAMAEAEDEVTGATRELVAAIFGWAAPEEGPQ